MLNDDEAIEVSDADVALEEEMAGEEEPSDGIDLNSADDEEEEEEDDESCSQMSEECPLPVQKKILKKLCFLTKRRINKH